MGVEFPVPASNRPVYQDIIRAVSLPDLVCAEDVAIDGPWPDAPLHFHCSGVSCRAIGVTYEEGTFRIRIPAFAAPEDFDLAIRMTTSLAGHCDSVVETEEGHTLAPDRVRDTLNDEWISGPIEACAERRAAMIREEPGCYQIPGPVRRFYIGPRWS